MHLLKHFCCSNNDQRGRVEGLRICVLVCRDPWIMGACFSHMLLMDLSGIWFRVIDTDDDEDPLHISFHNFSRLRSEARRYILVSYYENRRVTFRNLRANSYHDPKKYDWNGLMPASEQTVTRTLTSAFRWRRTQSKKIASPENTIEGPNSQSYSLFKPS